MNLRDIFRRLRSDTQGVSSLIMAGSLFAMIGSMALAIDLGSIYLAKRKLQGLADSAAMSLDNTDYVNGAEGVVRQLIVKDGSNTVTIQRLVPGHYAANASVAPKDRFQPSSDNDQINAIRIELQNDVPLIFGRILTSNASIRIGAKAIATRADLAAYSLSTQLTSVSPVITNALLSSLGNVQFNLTASQIATLSADRIDILSVGDALARRFDLAGHTYSDIFNRDYDVADLIAAFAEASSDSASAAILDAAAARAGTGQVRLSALIDLGQLGQSDYHDTADPLTIEAYTLLRAGLQLAQGDTYRAQVSVAATGLTNTSLTIVGKNATVHSPMMTVASARNVVLRTGATRIYLDTTASSAIGNLHIPIYSELAPGEARLTGISCADHSREGVTLGVKPSIGSADIGTVDLTRLDDFSQAMTVSPAQLARTLLLSVNATSHLALSGNAEREVVFTLDEVDAHTWKSVASSDIVASVAASLASNTQLDVRALGLGANTAAVTPVVGTVLSTIAPTLDSVIDSVLRSAGVQLGISNVTVDKVSCGVPVLVG